MHDSIDDGPLQVDGLDEASTTVRALAWVVVVVAAAALSGRVGPASPRSSAPAPLQVRVELNTASAAELALLPGIGPALGRRIVEDRRDRGPFTSVDDLARVSGVGAMTVERVRRDARVGRPGRSDRSQSR